MNREPSMLNQRKDYTPRQGRLSPRSYKFLGNNYKI